MLSNLKNNGKLSSSTGRLATVSCLLSLAVLCTAAPHLAPFMSDESTQSVPDIGPLKYTLKQYLSYAEALQDKAS